MDFKAIQNSYFMAIYNHFGPPNMCPQYGFKIQMNHSGDGKEKTILIVSPLCAYLHTPNVHYDDTVLEVGPCTNFMRYTQNLLNHQVTLQRISLARSSLTCPSLIVCVWHHNHYPHFGDARIYTFCAKKTIFPLRIPHTLYHIHRSRI